MNNNINTLILKEKRERDFNFTIHNKFLLFLSQIQAAKKSNNNEEISSF